MPARKINYTAGQIDNSKSHGNYLSKYSEREYETLLKAFLLLGERYDKLQSDYDEKLEDELKSLSREELEW